MTSTQPHRPPRIAAAKYAFRDCDSAAERLAEVNRVFESSYRSLLQAADLPETVNLAVDLGCGPGYTTRLLAEVVRPRSLAAIDISRSFIERARADAAVSANWHIHDVTTVPFPTGAADLIHSRWVLAHLQKPLDVLASWLTQLRPGGLLLVQEDERITSENQVLSSYQAISDSLVAHDGGDLYVGRRLADAAIPSQYERTLNRVYDHRISAPTAARIFAMNFKVWRSDPWVQDQHHAEMLDDLARQLHRLARSQDESDIVFSIRQVAIRCASRPQR